MLKLAWPVYSTETTTTIPTQSIPVVIVALDDNRCEYRAPGTCSASFAAASHIHRATVDQRVLSNSVAKLSYLLVLPGSTEEVTSIYLVECC